MDLIERLRPKWRHPDPQVRRPAVKKLDDAGDGEAVRFRVLLTELGLNK